MTSGAYSARSSSNVPLSVTSLTILDAFAPAFSVLQTLFNSSEGSATFSPTSSRNDPTVFLSSDTLFTTFVTIPEDEACTAAVPTFAALSLVLDAIMSGLDVAITALSNATMRSLNAVI